MSSRRRRTCSRTPSPPGLVRRGAQWPGLWTAPEQIGNTKLTAPWPKIFFDPKGYLPDKLELELSCPAGFASVAEFRALLSAALQDLEQRHQQELAAQGRRFLGVPRVLAQNPFARPPAGEPRFESSSRIAARDKWRRIEGLLRLKSFVHEYRLALARWSSGARSVVFPAAPTSCASSTASSALAQRRTLPLPLHPLSSVRSMCASLGGGVRETGSSRLRDAPTARRMPLAGTWFSSYSRSSTPDSRIERLSRPAPPCLSRLGYSRSGPRHAREPPLPTGGCTKDRAGPLVPGSG